MWNAFNQLPRIGGAWFGINQIRIAHFLNLSFIHYNHSVAHVFNYAEIMTDKDISKISEYFIIISSLENNHKQALFFGKIHG